MKVLLLNPPFLARYTIADLSDTIVKILGVDIKPIFDAQPNHNLKHDPRRRCPDLAKVRESLNYKPEVSLEEGLKRIIEWMKGG